MKAHSVLVACDGGTPLSHAAARVAEELERRGLVVRCGVGDHAARGENVVTLDGCRSACLSRRLIAEGRAPAHRLNLADCGVSEASLPTVVLEQLVDEVARRLASSSAPVALVRPRRPERRVAGSSRRAHTVGDYLLALDALTNPVAACGALVAGVPTLAAHVSGLLGVSRPSAGEMLARLEESGLVHRGDRKELVLTPSGRAAADRALLRHRLLEDFAVSFLGYTLPECYERARMLDSAFDDDALEHLRGALDGPARCPHGWPMDPTAARAEGDTLVSLTALGPGAAATVARVAENDVSLERLVELGVVPGIRIAAQTGGLYEVDGQTVHLAGGPAAAVLVQPV